jgi:riboflavin biosynthesis pyrimidine reductase
MFEADLVDEINLTIAPLLLGGSGARLVQEMNEQISRWQVAHLLEENGYFYTRYLRAQ